MQISPVTFALVMLFSRATLSGQDPEPDLNAGDTIVLEDVTISVLPFQEKYLEATGGLFIVASDEIRSSNAFPSTSLFNLAPGVHMASGSLNTNRIVIRGVGSRTPYSSNRIRAYLDDIPLTSGDGTSTLEDLDVYSIGTMEILKGPSSALYGSGLGGVIRLNSPYPRHHGFSTTISSEVGSFNTTRYGMTTSYKKNRFAMTGGLTRSSTDGYRENSDFQRTNAFINAQYFGEKHSVSLTFSLVDLYSGIPSSLNETDFTTDPEKAGGTWGTIHGFEEYLRLLSGIKVESRLGTNLKNRITLFSTYANPYERRPFNILDEESFNLGFRETLEYRSGNFNFSTGIEYFNEWFQWKIFETLPESQGPLQSDQSEIRRYLNGFVLVQWRPGERVVVDAGLNVNLLGYSLTTQYRADSSDQSGSYNYKPVVSPRIGISYNHGRQIWTYAAAGHGFSAPSLEETLLPEGTINTSLRPETGWNLELGNRGRLLGGQFEYDLAVYSIFLNDLLVTERISEDIFTGINAGKALNAGMEIMVKGSLHPLEENDGFNAGFMIGYNISRNIFTDFADEGADYSGNHLPGIPMQELSTILNGSFHGFGVRIHYRYTGNQWMNDANNDTYEGYQLLHLRMNWQHQLARSPFHIMIYGGVRNLLDTKYASMILINAPSFGGRAPRYYYPGAPRHLQMGLKLSYTINPI